LDENYVKYRGTAFLRFFLVYSRNNLFDAFIQALFDLKDAIEKDLEILWGNMEENIEFTLKIK
jgi:RNAse (barnase) inhibitor barstar